jgi:hypothetical protein
MKTTPFTELSVNGVSLSTTGSLLPQYCYYRHPLRSVTDEFLGMATHIKWNHWRWESLNPEQESTNKQNKTNSVALSRQANYTDWSTATCRRNVVPTFVDRGVSRGQRGGSPTVDNLSFLDRSRYFFFQVAPHLSSQGLSGPRFRPTATQKIS